MLIFIVLGALYIIIAVVAALVLWTLAVMSKMQEQQQDDMEAYRRLTTDFDRP